MTSTATFTTAADQARTAVERSTELWQQSTRSLTEQTDQLWPLPQLDAFSDASRKFVEYLEDGLEVNKNVFLKWFGALTSVTEAFGRQLEAVNEFQRGHGRAISTWISGESETFGNAAKQQVQQVGEIQVQQAKYAQKAEQDREEKARQAERDKAKAERGRARRARDDARERYQGLTKAELAEKLAERDLPKTGNVDELVERLVSADTN
jgi:hypothetical protein